MPTGYIDITYWRKTLDILDSQTLNENIDALKNLSELRVTAYSSRPTKVFDNVLRLLRLRAHKGIPFCAVLLESLHYSESDYPREMWPAEQERIKESLSTEGYTTTVSTHLLGWAVNGWKGRCSREACKACRRAVAG